MTIDPGMLYTLIGRLLESTPSAADMQRVNDPKVMAWLGKAEAYVKETYDPALTVEIRQGFSLLRSAIPKVRIDAATNIVGVLYRALAQAELKAPAGVAGTFIPVGNQFDAFSAVSKILKGAKQDVMIIDPYMDETVLTEFAVTIDDGPQLRLLTADKAQNASIAPAVEKWRGQHGPQRPIELRFAASKELHDRLLLVDGQSAYLLTQSIRDIAKRSPAEIVRTDHSAAMKFESYEEIWKNARRP